MPTSQSVSTEEVIKTVRDMSQDKKMRKYLSRELSQMYRQNQAFNEKRRNFGRAMAKWRVTQGKADQETKEKESINDLCADSAKALKNSATASFVQSLLTKKWYETRSNFVVDSKIRGERKRYRLKVLTHRRDLRS